MKYVSLVLLGLLMAVLAGCGGGGDGGKGDKITELTADLEAALGKLSTTEQTLKTTQGDLTATKGTLSTTRDELKMTKETLSTAQETLSTTQGQLTTTQGELKATQGQLSATQGELETTEDSLTTTKDSLTITQGVLETTQDELETTRETLSTTKTQLETAQKDLASKEQALTTLLIKTGVETVTALSAELDRYKTVQNQVDALLTKAGVETLTALSARLDTDSDLQRDVQAVLTATGAASLTALQTAYDKAKQDYTALNAQVKAALTATNSTSLTALQTTVASLRNEVSSLTNRLNEANKKVQDVQDNLAKQVTVAEANARSFGLLRALQVELRSAASDNAQGNTTTQISPGGTPPGGTPPTVAIHNTPSGISVSATPLASSKKGSASPSLSVGGTSLRGTRLSRTEAGGLVEEVVVYTDFKGSRVKLLDYTTDSFTGALPSAQVMGTREGTTDNRYLELNSAIVGMTFLDKLIVQPSSSVTLQSGSVLLTAPPIRTPTQGDPDYETIDIENKSDTDPDNHTKVTHTVQKRSKKAWAGVTLSHKTSGQSIIYETTKTTKNKVDTKVDPTPDTDIKVSFSGTVRGVSGTFSCIGGSGCDFTINTQRKEAGGFQPLSYVVTTGANPWNFKPSSASATTPADDQEYFYFGWWQKTPNLADGDYTFRLLAGGAGYWGEGTSTTVTTGTARYTGPAVGKYVKKSPLASVSERRYTDGTFTASTVLDVTFGGDSNSSVKGTVSEFKDGGKAIEGNWLVELENISGLPFGNTDGSNGATGIATLKINGKAPAQSMTANAWQVWFFKDHTTPATASTPRAAAGRFDVGLEDDLLHISGVFGAKVN